MARSLFNPALMGPLCRRLCAAWTVVLVLVFLASCSPGSRFTQRQGFVNATGGKVWYRVVGSGDATPVILLHGGPGSASDYLKPLEGLAVDRPVIFYDQLGCGRSDRPNDASLWKIERFVEELGQLREALKLKEVYIYGHSWGTMLAVDYMLTDPQGVRGLVLASPCLSVERWATDANRFIEDLPYPVRAAIRRNEKDGTTNSPEYEAAAMEYLKRHLCRIDPWPKELTDSFNMSNAAVYRVMWGPSEFRPTGNLKTYERVDRLEEIRVPTFFTAGRFDEATPEATAWYRSQVPDSTIQIFEKSSHMTMFEEREAYVESIREFLSGLDRRRARN